MVSLHVPPPRERPEDIGLLAEHFLKRFGRETGKRLGLHGVGVAVSPAPAARRVAIASRLVYQRLAKVACHEAGRALGVTHCHARDCLMRFTHDLAKQDNLSPALCPACGRAFHRARPRLS